MSSDSLPRGRALRLLVESDTADKVAVLAAIARKKKDDTVARYVAARLLGEVGTRAAVNALVALTKVKVEHVRVGVLHALGLCGDEAALDAVIQASRGAGARVAAVARFAAALIAYRLGRAGHEPAWPKPGDALQVPARKARRFTIVPTSGGERIGVLESIGAQAYGISLGAAAVYWTGCEGAPRLALVLSPLVVGPDALETLQRRRTLAGLLAYPAPNDLREYSISHVIFSRPRRGGTIDLLVSDTRGEAAFAGRLQAEGDHASFTIWALPRPRAAALDAEGTYDGRSLHLSRGRSAFTPQIPPRQLVSARVERLASRA